MSIITPIKDKVFGAVITDITLRELNDEEVATIKSSFLEYGFLVFPEQFLTLEESTAFGELFGEVQFGGRHIANRKPLGDGSFENFEPRDQNMMGILGNQNWHADSTYMPVSAKCGILTAVAVPDEGGETEFADMRAGYAALDDATKECAESLSAYHSTQISQAYDNGYFPPKDTETIFHGEAYLRPLVKTHPETGVKNLFIGRHAFSIPGLERNESRELLKSLVEFVVSDPSRTYCHDWQVGDTIIWDNRSLLHRARPYDYRQPRVLIGTRIAGDPKSELASCPDDSEAQAGRDAVTTELELLREENDGKGFQWQKQLGY